MPEGTLLAVNGVAGGPQPVRGGFRYGIEIELPKANQDAIATVIALRVDGQAMDIKPVEVPDQPAHLQARAELIRRWLMTEPPRWDAPKVSPMVRTLPAFSGTVGAVAGEPFFPPAEAGCRASRPIVWSNSE